MAKITKIEPQIPALPTRKKVAAYARVSMETERLHHSLSTQVSYYSELIQKNPEWEYVGVYADEAISGTIAKKRDEFQRLIADCEAGKIDIVLCKSISRFARNTVDLLKTVRHLKELGISVRFEKENIDSLSGDGEVMLTLLASFAQSESESISNNVKWGVRKRMEQGIPNGHFRVYGYRWEGDQLVIVPEEAAIVKRIYQNFLDGKSRLETEREFAAEGITTREGCRWVDSNIKVVLSNITYTGNIWTFDGKGELLITIMSSLAQEESRSISENCTWGQRKRFADGKVTIPFNRFLGYDRGANGELVVNPEQAKVVRSIYDMFLQGTTYHGIAQKLTDDGIKTPGGKDKWSISTVKSILSNEKYKGDALLQKCFTVDYLTKKQKKNEGEIPQYYVEGNHEAIIPPEKFDMVQREMAKRGKGKKYHSGVHPFSSKIRCGQCGSWYGSKVWHSTDKYRRTIWQCNHKYDGGKHCCTPHLTDEQIQDAFLSAANQLLATKDAVIANGREMMALLFDTTEQEAERDKLLEEAQVVSDAVQQNIYENAHVALDQKAYQKKYDDLTARYETLKTSIEDLNEQISQTQSQKGSVEDFLAAFEKLPETLTAFSLDAFNALTDYLTVNGEGDISVTFRNGQTIRA